MKKIGVFAAFLVLFTISLAFARTDPNDYKILDDFRKGLENAELLNWPENNDPCGPPSWKYIFCQDDRVAQIQAKDLGLKGPLPQNFNQLSKLSNVGLQRNHFSGSVPSFSGLSELKYVYLDYNEFDSIPVDFFGGLTSLQVLALDYIPLNKSTGWMFPPGLKSSAQLQNLSCTHCGLKGPLPDFLGDLSSLSMLQLALNQISGAIPSSLGSLSLQMLWVNGNGMTGPIDVVTSMTSLTSLWLHGNTFSGKISEKIGDLVFLKDLNVNSNDLVGLLPESLSKLPLEKVDLNNNKFMGPVPIIKAGNYTYSSNLFCETVPGKPCAPEVMALLEFLDSVNYPLRLVSSWAGNDPCTWLGIGCDVNNKVSSINLPKFDLSGQLSPSLSELSALKEIKLPYNRLTGSIPSNLTSLKSLSLLDVSNNNISAPLPKFASSVKLNLDNNSLLNNNKTEPPPIPSTSPPGSPGSPRSVSPTQEEGHSKNNLKLLAIVVSIVFFVVVVFLVVPCLIWYRTKKKDDNQALSSLVIHPRDSPDPGNYVKIAVANTDGSVSTVAGSGSGSINTSSVGQSHIIEDGNFTISVQVLRKATDNFAPKNELGRGGFGVVYKGELDDGTKIAVKRMESGVISNKAVDEFEAEIEVLSKVRHRHLVTLHGYSVEGNEKMLVYEYMPQGALSRHLFHWKGFKLEPLSWKRRLNIALDVARGLEYLHNLAHRSFIHRDLKPSNILLGDDYKAKISDFGLVKLAPNGEKSMVTKLAGTFGYLAPEYAVTGKITTKVDVFSFGVVLMELITGLMALDEDRPEESQYLAAWFWKIKSNKEKLRAAIDPTLEVKEETLKGISIVAELAGHCTAREPSQRPEIGHAVNMLAPLVEKWKPLDDDTEDYCGIDYSLPLDQMVKGWQDAEGKDSGYMDLEDSKGSIPSRPTGFAESFTSADGR